MIAEVIECFRDRKLSKGCLAYGMKAEDSKDPGEVLPWEEVHEIHALSILGAMCLVKRAGMDDSEIQEVYHHLSAVLGQDLEVWNDDPEVTKKQVVDFLRSSIVGSGHD